MHLSISAFTAAIVVSVLFFGSVPFGVGFGFCCDAPQPIGKGNSRKKKRFFVLQKKGVRGMGGVPVMRVNRGEEEKKKSDKSDESKKKVSA